MPLGRDETERRGKGGRYAEHSHSGSHPGIHTHNGEKK